MLTVTLEQVLAFAVTGTVVSLVLEYFPKLNVWYNAQPDRIQKLLILGSGLVVVLGAFGLSCAGLLVGLPWACTWASVWDVVASYLAFVFATQGTYLVTPKASDA
jgi:hypothetical protein